MKRFKISRTRLQALYDEWSQSGETQKAFLKRKQISFSVFNNHFHLIKTQRPKKQRPEAMKLLPVQVVHEATQPSHRISKLWVQLLSGASLHFTTDVPAQYMGTLLSAMEPRPSC